MPICTVGTPAGGTRHSHVAIPPKRVPMAMTKSADDTIRLALQWEYLPTTTHVERMVGGKGHLAVQGSCHGNGKHLRQLGHLRPGAGGHDAGA